VSTEDPGAPRLPELQGFRSEVLSRSDLPTIPVVLGRILAVVEGERSPTRDLVEVIERDQALTSRLLKLSNSALFGSSRKVATVPRAVVLLGFNTVRNLALGVKVWDTLAVGGRQREMVATLWHHSALVAAASRLIAARIRGTDSDISFTAGLLHDIGKLVFSLKLGLRYWSLVGGVSGGQTIEMIERDQLGVDHAEVGGWLSESWRLPPEIVTAIRQHHEPFRTDQWSPARVVSVANRLVHGTDFATGETGPVAAEVLEEVAAHGFTAEDWANTLGPLKEEADTLAALFRTS
jgi:putative nucleotidyltransferase with HDIG domain